MGFGWGGSVCVEFGVRVKAPDCMARFAKRLSHFRPVAPTLFASTAKTLADVGSLEAVDQLPEQVAKRARQEARPLPADDDGVSAFNGSDAGTDVYGFSDVPSDMDDDELAVYEPIAKECEKKYFPDYTCDLEYNYPELIDNAFDHAVAKVLGEDHDFELMYDAHSGAHGECHEDALENAVWIRSKSLVFAHEGGLDAPRGGISGVPWGIGMIPIPMDQDTAPIREKIKRILEAFGLEPEEEIGWRLVTRASGG